MKKNRGFTVVELVIAITISGVFTIGIFQLFSGINHLSTESSSCTIASNIAYNNMRKYANGQKPLWFNCIGDEAGETTPPFSDGKSKPTATGQELMNITTNSLVQTLPPPVIESVIAIAPYGCGNSAPGQPIRVQAQVKFGQGSKQRTITHATYVSY